MSRSRLTGSTLFAAAATLGACSSNAGPQPTPSARWGDVGPESITGKVRQVGNLPFTRTLVDAGEDERIFVTGDLESEISRLAGMDVQVTGSYTEGNQPGIYILATSYELQEIDGERPVVGVLRHDADGFYLDLFDGRTHRLSQVPPELEEAGEAKVWVIAEEGAHVRAYGILREAAR
jgi:hypothetical protein